MPARGWFSTGFAWSRFPTCLLAAFATAVTATPTVAWALAAPPADARFARGGVRMGYNGVAPPERWSPLTVTIQPGDKPQSLRLTVTYDQDPTQRAVISAAVTTTPGQQTTVPLLVCPPQGLDRIDVTLTSEGSVLDRAAFTRSPGPRELNLPVQVQTGGAVIGTLGVRIKPAALTGAADTGGTTYNMTRLERDMFTALGVDDLTQTWAGLDGLNAVVARQSVLDRVPGATLDALATWVTGGGRLILIADSPGTTWRRFVPPGVYARDLGPTLPPASLSRVLTAGTELAKSVNARPISIDPTAAALGWAIDHPLADAARSGALVASGPFGGGFTAIVGADPTLLTAQLDDAALAPLWTALINRALPDRQPVQNEPQSAYYPYSSSSGDSPTAAAALRSAVDALCDVPPVPTAVYTVIVLLACALALAVSFGDFIILGRLRSRQRSWLTATCWIGLCGVLAWVLPNVVRGGDTSLGRAVVIDAMPAAEPARPVIWRTGVTAVFAASSGALPLRPVVASSQAAARAQLAGYWRGVSVLEVYSYYRSESKPTVSNLPLVQHISALDGSTAALTPPEGGLPIRQWTLRTLEDQSPIATAPAARFTSGGEHGAFIVTGLPRGAVFKSGAVHTARGWSPLQAESQADASGPRRFTVSAQPAASLAGWNQLPPAPRQSAQPYYNPYESRRVGPADGQRYLQLDGAHRRTAAFDAIVTAGEYAVVHLLVEAPPDITTPAQHRERGVYVYRLAVPLTESAPPLPAVPADPAPASP